MAESVPETSESDSPVKPPKGCMFVSIPKWTRIKAERDQLREEVRRAAVSVRVAEMQADHLLKVLRDEYDRQSKVANALHLTTDNIVNGRGRRSIYGPPW